MRIDVVPAGCHFGRVIAAVLAGRGDLLLNLLLFVLFSGGLLLRLLRLLLGLLNLLLRLLLLDLLLLDLLLRLLRLSLRLLLLRLVLLLDLHRRLRLRVVIVVAAANQSQTGCADASATAGPQNGTAAHLRSTYALPVHSTFRFRVHQHRFLTG